MERSSTLEKKRKKHNFEKFIWKNGGNSFYDKNGNEVKKEKKKKKKIFFYFFLNFKKKIKTKKF